MTKDLDTTGKRLRFARGRMGWSGKEAMTRLQAIRTRKGRKAASERSLFSHEWGERNPTQAALEDYAELYGVSEDFLRSGKGADAYLNSEFGMPDSSDGGPGDGISSEGINQLTENAQRNSSHNFSVRHIVILSTGTLKELKQWTGDLTAMSAGKKMPVPDILPAGRSYFAYEIPAHDHAMVVPQGVSFGPGTHLVVDPAKQILPGDYILADLDGFADPVFRIYESDRPYGPGVRFSLTALNPSYKAIDVADPAQCRKIGLVVSFTGLLLRR